MTATNKIPRKIFVLIIAIISNPFEIFFANIWVIIRMDAINIINNSIENRPVDDVMMKNQNESPAVTASDLNLGEEVSMLYRIDKCHQTWLGKSCYSY